MRQMRRLELIESALFTSVLPTGTCEPPIECPRTDGNMHAARRSASNLASSIVTLRSRAETLRARVSGNLARNSHLPSMDARFNCYSLPAFARRNGSKTVAATS